MRAKKLAELSREERSLLLFFEANAVDHRGKLSTQHMNADDIEIANRWKMEGFIDWGRIPMSDIREDHGNVQIAPRSHWVVLSDEAIQLAQEERRARIVRMKPYGLEAVKA